MRILPVIAFALLLSACGEQNAARLRNAPPGLDIARAAMTAGTPDVALNVSNSILATKPKYIPALLARADALTALGRSAEAETTYMNALRLDPASTGAKIGLGRLRLHSDPAQAEVMFLNVLQREPSNTVALNDLGIALDLKGDHTGAQAAYRRALGSDPTMRAAEVNLALSMAVSGKAAEAVRMLRPLASNPNATPRVRHDLAVALAAAGDRQTAAAILAKDMSPEQVDQAMAAFGALTQ